jgi:hypothetical protein
MTLINWLLKLKMHVNTYILFEFFCIKIQYEFFIFLRDFAECMETRHLFCCFSIFFCNISEKTEYFNIKFVSLQCKNTNQY